MKHVQRIVAAIGRLLCEVRRTEGEYHQIGFPPQEARHLTHAKETTGLKRYALQVPFLGLTAVLALAGCGGGNNSSSTMRNATVPPFTPANDVQFIDAMMTHHDMAVQMTTLEIQKGTRADIKAMAQTMKDAQSAEMAAMRTARQALTGSPDVPAPPTDKHMNDDMMLLQEATGAQVDAVFLEHMIVHHSEAISIAHRAMPNLQRADLKTMATNITTSQAKEVGDMQAMR